MARIENGPLKESGHISNPTRAHGLMHHGKDRKWFIKRKWMEREYHVHDINMCHKKSGNVMCYNSFPGISILWYTKKTSWGEMVKQTLSLENIP